MKKQKKSKQKSNRGRGPLARKVIDSARQQLQRKVTSLSEWKEGKLKSEEYQKGIISEDKLNKIDPLHALYMYSQNHLSVLIEQITELSILDKLADRYAKASDQYMPFGPPVSPLTGSYFTCWGAFDLCTLGAKKETLCTIVIDFCKFINADHGQIEVFEEMQNSRMGIYKHSGVSGKYINFQEQSIADLAKAESISEGTLYNWRDKARKQGILLPDGNSSPEGWTTRDLPLLWRVWCSMKSNRANIVERKGFIRNK
jgi:hypothetical protein